MRRRRSGWRLMWKRVSCFTSEFLSHLIHSVSKNFLLLNELWMFLVVNIELRKISHNGSCSPKHLHLVAINWSFYVVVLEWTATKCTKVLKERANTSFCSLTVKTLSGQGPYDAKWPSLAYIVERERRQLIFRLNASHTKLEQILRQIDAVNRSRQLLACVQPLLPSKKIGKDFFLRGGTAVHRLDNCKI